MLIIINTGNNWSIYLQVIFSILLLFQYLRTNTSDQKYPNKDRNICGINKNYVRYVVECAHDANIYVDYLVKDVRTIISLTNTIL